MLINIKHYRSFQQVWVVGFFFFLPCLVFILSAFILVPLLIQLRLPAAVNRQQQRVGLLHVIQPPTCSSSRWGGGSQMGSTKVEIWELAELIRIKTIKRPFPASGQITKHPIAAFYRDRTFFPPPIVVCWFGGFFFGHFFFTNCKKKIIKWSFFGFFFCFPSHCVVW